MIQETLELIEKQTGLKLTLCDYFAGLRYHNGMPYFNVVIDSIVSESKEYDLLERFAKQYSLINVEPNGYKRLAIYINQNNQQ